MAGHTASFSRVGRLIKTKDHEGNSPFDLYHSTIGERDIRDMAEHQGRDVDSDSEDAHSLDERSS